MDIIKGKYENCDEICRVNEAFLKVLENEDKYELEEGYDEQQWDELRNRKISDVLKKAETGSGNFEELEKRLMDDSKDNPYYGFVPVKYLKGSRAYLVRSKIGGLDDGKIEIYDPVEDRAIFSRKGDVVFNPMNLEDRVDQMTLSSEREKFIQFKIKQVGEATKKKNEKLRSYPENEFQFKIICMLFNSDIPLMKRITLGKKYWKNENGYDPKKEKDFCWLLSVITSTLTEWRVKRDIGDDYFNYETRKNYLMKIIQRIVLHSLKSKNPVKLSDVDPDRFKNPPSVKGTEFEFWFWDKDGEEKVEKKEEPKS